MIEAKKIYDDIVTLKARPDLVMHEDLKNIDELVIDLKCQKPAITLEQSIETLNS